MPCEAMVGGIRIHDGAYGTELGGARLLETLGWYLALR